MSIIINPGTEPVLDTKEEDSEASIHEFMDQVREHVGYELQYERMREDNDGWYAWRLHCRELSTRVDIDMPGLPPDQLQLGPWKSPRLYVDGSSWLWKYALNMAVNKLLGEE